MICARCQALREPLYFNGLLGIRSPNELEGHPLRGAMLESFVVSEFTKAILNRAERSDLHHWRDRGGHEVDLIVDRGLEPDAYEVKAGRTIRSEALRGLEWWRELAEERFDRGPVVYGGDEPQGRHGRGLIPWFACS